MLEIEQKFRVPDHAAVRAALDRLGAPPDAGHVESDHYFDAPDRDFAATGEAFRLRVVEPANVLTYKGPKLPGPAKTRVEIELAVEPGYAGTEKTVTMLKRLGYRPVRVVRKSRASARLCRDGFAVTVCLDEVFQVGRFVEVEVLADEPRSAAAQAAVLAVAAELGLTDPEPRSYLRMLLEAAP